MVMAAILVAAGMNIVVVGGKFNLGKEGGIVLGVVPPRRDAIEQLSAARQLLNYVETDGAMKGG